MNKLPPRAVVTPNATCGIDAETHDVVRLMRRMNAIKGVLVVSLGAYREDPSYTRLHVTGMTEGDCDEYLYNRNFDVVGSFADDRTPLDVGSIC